MSQGTSTTSTTNNQQQQQAPLPINDFLLTKFTQQQLQSSLNAIENHLIDINYITTHTEKDLIDLGIQARVAADLKEHYGSQQPSEQPTAPQQPVKRYFSYLELVNRIKDSFGEQTRQIPKLTDHSYPFEGRASEIKQIIHETQKRYDNIYKSNMYKEAHPFLVIAGSPGIGKTRFIEQYGEIFKNIGIDKPFIHLLISYGNGTSITNLDIKYGGAYSVCCRLLYKYLVEGSLCDSFQNFITFIESNGIMINDINYCIQCIINHLQKSGMVPESGNGYAITIGVDEFQKTLGTEIPGILQRYDQVLLSNDDKNRAFLKEIIDSIAPLMFNSIHGNFFVITLAGTLISPISMVITTSTYKYSQIKFSLLSFKESESIAMKYLQTNGIQIETFPLLVRKVIGFIGGMARPLSIFINWLFTVLKENIGYFNGNISILTPIDHIIANTSIGIMPSDEICQKIFALALTLLEIEKSKWTALFLNSQISLEIMESRGIFTSILDGTNYRISIPLLYLKYYQGNRPGILKDFLDHLLQCNSWQGWEILCSIYETLRAYMFRVLGLNNISIKQFFSLDNSSDWVNLHNINFILSNDPELIRINQRIPESNQLFEFIPGKVYLNAPGANVDSISCYTTPDGTSITFPPSSSLSNYEQVPIKYVYFICNEKNTTVNTGLSPSVITPSLNSMMNAINTIKGSTNNKVFYKIFITNRKRVSDTTLKSLKNENNIIIINKTSTYFKPIQHIIDPLFYE